MDMITTFTLSTCRVSAAVVDGVDAFGKTSDIVTSFLVPAAPVRVINLCRSHCPFQDYFTFLSVLL